MSEIDKDQPSSPGENAGRKKRRFLSPEKKYQVFLESQRGEVPVGELLRREGLYSTDLARIQKKVKEGALERLADRPGQRRKTVSESEYARLKKELEEKERVMAEMTVELAILRKKTNGGSWER
jgi:transposase-like protein